MGSRTESRRRRARVLAAAGVLAAAQAVAVVGAGSALAAGTCTYNPATDEVQITVNTGTSSTLTIDPNTAAFELDGAACGSATNANVATVVVLGQPSSDEQLVIDHQAGDPFNPAIVWAIDLGTGTADGLVITGPNMTGDTFVVTDTTFSMNGSVGELLGIEILTLNGNNGNDVLDGSALSAGVQLIANGGAGQDVVAPGAFNGDVVDGGSSVADRLTYGSRTTCTVIDRALGVAGRDANCDGDLLDVGDEVDLHTTFEILETGSGNDTLIGALGPDETFVPGDGDDSITGNPGDTDTIDWSSSSAGMTIDPATGMATGQGTDTFTGVTRFVGSAFDDLLIFDGTTTFFSGLGGVDTVDGSANAFVQVIDLDTLDGDPLGPTPDDLENAFGGSAADTLLGNDLQNRLVGNDGDDGLFGFAGNDRLEGGNGNDTYAGGLGADRVKFDTTQDGVDVDLILGFATGEGDDSFTFVGGIPDVEIIIGSQGDDTINGGKTGFGSAINFRFTGRGGEDLLIGSDSNDTLRGGAGDDTLIAGAGNDVLKGGSGNDRGFGGPGTDVCKKVEQARSC